MTSTSSATRRTTINDVARAASVSRQTVSNVVNAPERVAPDTLARVQAQIEILGFRPNRAAQSLKQERAGAWGLELNSAGFGRLGSIIDTFLIELTGGASVRGSHVVPFTAPDPTAPIPSYERLVASRVADGFVLTDTRRNDPRPGWLDAHHVPYAAFGRVWDDPSITSWVDVDGASGIEAAVHHLAAQGYEKIGYLGWPEGSPVGDDRRSGWLRATAELGLAHPEWQATSPQAPSLRPAPRPACSTSSDVVPRSCAPPTHWPWASGASSSNAGCRRASTSASSASTTRTSRTRSTSAVSTSPSTGSPTVCSTCSVPVPTPAIPRVVSSSPELVVRSSSKPAGDRMTRKEK